MNLKIAYISDERFPSLHTDTQQVVKTMDALGRLDVHVDLIQPRLFSHLGKSTAMRKDEICQYYNVEGNFHLRDILFWPASDLRFEKLFHGIAAPLKVFLGKYDVVYTRNIIPLTLAAKMGMPVLFETYKALPKTEPWAWRMVKRNISAKRFIGISTHSEYSRQVMIEAGVPERLVETIPNGFDPKDFDDLPSKQQAREKLGLDQDRKILVYTGHIREDKGIHSLLDIAEECPEALMLIVGGKPQEIEEMNTAVTQRSLPNVQFVAQVPIREVPDYLCAADILVLPTSSIPLQKATVLPMKTFTYMAAGRPIVAPDLADTQGVLVDNVNCVRVTPDVPSAAAAAIRDLLHSTEKAEMLANRAKEDAKKFTWDGRAKNLVRFLHRRLGNE